jgi:hypothetical protein
MPRTLPPLPLRSQPWSPNVYHAFQILSDIYRTAKAALDQENYDLYRIRFHGDSVANDAVPLLFTLEESAEEEGLPVSWVHDASHHYENLIVELAEAEKTALGVCVIVPVVLPTTYLDVFHRESSNIGHVEPVTVELSGRRGRPRKVVNMEYLNEAMDASRHISLTKLAKVLGIHRNTLRMYLKKYKVDYKFSDMSNEDLDLLVKTFRAENPDSGIRYLIGFLRRHGVRVQKRRVTASISRVDRLGHRLRQRQHAKVRRRNYQVTRPNALWHIDGHHKLILWGIVIHGCVDGYSRTVC